MPKKKPEKQLDLVGLAEVADMLGLRRGSAKSRRETHFDTFPTPIAQLACGPIWPRSQIADYLELEERLGHRPRWIHQAYPGEWPPWRKAALERALMSLKVADPSQQSSRS
jgi:hypothetical protein